MRCLRVLDDVRERLLDDAVERGLDLGRQALLAEPSLEIDVDVGLLGERLGEPLERGNEAEVVERLGPAARRRGGGRPGASSTTSSRSASRPRALGRSSTTPRSTAGRAGSRSAPGRSRRAAHGRAAAARAPAPRRPGEARRARRAARDRSRAPRAAANDLGEPDVVVAEARRRATFLSCATRTPIARSRSDQRHVEPRSGAGCRRGRPTGRPRDRR